jgi:putative spermidine/putrescine transport system ATP-binding protein
MFFELKSVSKRYGRKSIIEDVSFQVERGDIVSIIGPSGVGKTTLLKLIAGLEEVSAGSIHFEVTPTVNHPVILVFQDFILFPNLSVFDNVSFGLRARKMDGEEIEHRVMSILSYFNLRELRESYPAKLSAGQRQRVAIARAMVVNPSVLLLDEPFAHLDKNLRLETAEFIRSTQKQFGVTTVSVTHDLQEAFAMSDKIGIMLNGRLIQYDTAEKIYFEPNTFEVAKFLGPVNIIPESLFDVLGVGLENRARGVEVFARAEGIAIEKDEEGPGVVVDVCFVGVLILYKIELAGNSFTVYSLSNGISEGDRVRLRVLRFSTSPDDAS